MKNRWAWVQETFSKIHFLSKRGSKEILSSKRFDKKSNAPQPDQRVGLALSSGGAKGLTHIGVIQVLEENGIHVDVISGSSMGAYVGAHWAHGYNGKEMEELAAEIHSTKKLLSLVDPVFPPRKGFIHGKKAKRHLMKSIGEVHFSELKKELYIIGTNLDTLERKVFSNGPVALAVRASISIPGVFVPVKIGPCLYVDGSVCDPLPIQVLKDMGVGKIIAVSTIPSRDDLLHCFFEDQKQERVKKNIRQRMLGFLNKHLNYFAKDNLLDIMMRSNQASQIRLAQHSASKADILLRTSASDSRWHDYTNFERFIELGRQAAEQKLPEIKNLISSKETVSK